MGFSVTSSHLIIMVASLVAGSAFAAAAIQATKVVDEGEREAARTRAGYVHTEMEFLEEAPYPEYDAAAETYEVRLRNTGSVVLRVSKMTYLIDGVYASDRVDGTPTVDGNADTDLWIPSEVLQVRFTGVTLEPERFGAYAETGGAVFYTR